MPSKESNGRTLKLALPRSKKHSEGQTRAMRAISRRLCRLEKAVGPIGGPPLTIQIQFLSRDGEVTNGPVFTIGGRDYRSSGPRERPRSADAPPRMTNLTGRLPKAV